MSTDQPAKPEEQVIVTPGGPDNTLPETPTPPPDNTIEAPPPEPTHPIEEPPPSPDVPEGKKGHLDVDVDVEQGPREGPPPATPKK